MELRHITKAMALPALFISLALAPFASAQEEIGDMDLQQLGSLTVSGVSRFSQPLSNAPATVTVITADQIKRQGYRNLAEMLASVRGFAVTGDRNYTYIGVRGFGRTGDYNTRILTLVDGHRVNENIYDASYYANEFILDLDLIDRIEFIRGPASAVYGDNAFFGVVNVITRKGRAISGTEVSASAGSLDTYGGSATYGSHFRNGLDMVLSASFLDSTGKRAYYIPAFDDPSTNNGIADNLDSEETYRLFSSFSLADFSLESAFVRRKKEVPTAQFGAMFNQSPAYTVDRRAFVNLRYDHTFNGTLTVMGRIFYDNYSYFGKFPYATGGTPPHTVNKDAAYNQWIGGELQGSYPIFASNLLLAGVEYQKNLQQKFRNYDMDPYTPYLDMDRTTNRVAIYFQDEQEILTTLIVNAGVRIDHFSTFGTTVNPRAAVIYKPFPGTTGKLLYGEAFRAPNSYELNFELPAFYYKGNPDLSPERIRSYELVLEQSLGHHMRLTATGFVNHIRDLITQVTDPLDNMRVFVNRNRVEAQGIEVELEGKWGNGLQSRMSYARQQATDMDTGEWLENSPRHLAKGSLTLPIWNDRISAGTELHYAGKRLGRNRLPMGGYLLAHLTLFTRKLLPGVEISASVYNIFDKEYGDPANDDQMTGVQLIPQDGRTYRVKAVWAF